MTLDPKVREAIERVDASIHLMRDAGYESHEVMPDDWATIRSALVAKGEGAVELPAELDPDAMEAAVEAARSKPPHRDGRVGYAQIRAAYDAIKAYAHPAPKPASEPSPEPARDAGDAEAIQFAVLDCRSAAANYKSATWLRNADLIERLAAERDEANERNTTRRAWKQRAIAAERSLAEARKALEITAKRYREMATRLEAEAGIIDAALSRES